MTATTARVPRTARLAHAYHRAIVRAERRRHQVNHALPLMPQLRMEDQAIDLTGRIIDQLWIDPVTIAAELSAYTREAY
jgi:hypothetical protein